MAMNVRIDGCRTELLSDKGAGNLSEAASKVGPQPG
jgi:hypothetical protein